MSSSRPVAPAKLRAAQVLRAHGVRGEVRAEPIGGDPSRFTPGTVLETEDGTRTLTVRTSRPGPGNAVLLGFDEVTSPTDAALLRGVYLCVDVDAARPLPDGEWFVWQLVGLRVVDTAGAESASSTMSKRVWAMTCSSFAMRAVCTGCRWSATT